jgi:cytoskeletal protein RodZ
MVQSLARPSKTIAMSACILGLGVIALTGCDDSKNGDKAKAKAQAEAKAEQPAEESSSDKEKDESAETKKADKQGSAAPSAGTDKAKEGDGSDGEKITDEELKKFVEVSNTLRPKQAEMKTALKNAESKAEARKVQKNVMMQTRKAVEEAGLSFERFRTIAEQAKKSREMKKRLQRISMEMNGGGK